MKTSNKVQTTKKDNWFKISIECAIDTDTAPKWFKAKIKEVQTQFNITKENATLILIKIIDKIISEKIKNIKPTKEIFDLRKNGEKENA